MLYIRKSVLMGLVVVAIGAGWLAKTIAQEDSSSPVTYFSHEKMDASFAKGGSVVLFSGHSAQGPFSVDTDSRVQAGEATVHHHTTFTGVLYVVSGAATFINGSTAVAAKNTAPDKSGGQPIQAGESHRISKGDLLIVPPDVPQFYRNVDTESPFRYIVVHVP